MPREKLYALLAGLSSGRSRSASADSRDPFGGRDSIAKLEALLAIEAAFDISLSDEELAAVRTLDDLENLVVAKCAVSPPTPIAAESTTPPSSAGATVATTAIAPDTRVASSMPPVPVARWGRPVSAVLSFWIHTWFSLNVSGSQHLPPSGPCLLCPNHASHLDSLVLLAAAGPLRERLVFAAAKDYFFSRPRLARWTERAFPVIPWERGGNPAAMRENLRHLSACREAGRIVVFFPEGGRSRSGELQPFKDGLAFFALQTGLPVVPCWIDGAHRALPKGATFPRPGRLRVAFGAPLPAPVPGDPDFATRVRAALLALQPPTR